MSTSSIVNLSIATLVLLVPLGTCREFTVNQGGLNVIISEGVQVDYSYNESASSPDIIVSSPGCPKSTSGYPWVQFEGRCFLAGFTAGCPDNMKMFYRKQSSDGICFCDCIHYSNIRVKGYCLSPSSLRHVVYLRHLKRCHILFEQGPCPTNQWLTLDSSTGHAVCEFRRCLPMTGAHSIVESLEFEFNSYSFYNYKKDRCFASGMIDQRSMSGILQPTNSDWIPQPKRWEFGAPIHELIFQPTFVFPKSNDDCPTGKIFSKELGLCLNEFSSIYEE